MIINIATVAVIWVGAGRVDAGIISQGKVIALVNYMAQILVELIKMANLIILISKAVACMKRVDSVFEIKSSIEEKPHEIKTQNTENEMETTQKISPETAKVEFDHVDFAYARAKSDSLTDISFKAMKGQTIGVIGGTGSGKSTLVKCIMGEIEHEGTLTIGHNVQIGYFAQNQASLLDENLTVFQTIDDVAKG